MIPWVNIPPLEEVEGVTQPQSPQHEQQTEDRPFSCCDHQRLGQGDRLRLIMMLQHRLVLHLLDELIKLLKHQRGVRGQSGPVVEVMEN